LKALVSQIFCGKLSAPASFFYYSPFNKGMWVEKYISSAADLYSKIRIIEDILKEIAQAKRSLVSLMRETRN
jgi:hypothetical protein